MNRSINHYQGKRVEILIYRWKDILTKSYPLSFPRGDGSK
jgi:hypothetical protein